MQMPWISPHSVVVWKRVTTRSATNAGSAQRLRGVMSQKHVTRIAPMIDQQSVHTFSLSIHEGMLKRVFDYSVYTLSLSLGTQRYFANDDRLYVCRSPVDMCDGTPIHAKHNYPYFLCVSLMVPYQMMLSTCTVGNNTNKSKATHIAIPLP